MYSIQSVLPDAAELSAVPVFILTISKLIFLTFPVYILEEAVTISAAVLYTGQSGDWVIIGCSVSVDTTKSLGNWLLIALLHPAKHAVIISESIIAKNRFM